MADQITLDIIVVIFFWIGMWGIINISLDFTFDKLNAENDRWFKFVVYLIIALVGLFLVNYIMAEDDIDDEKHIILC